METTTTSFELTREMMWLPLLVVLAPPFIFVGWYFLNERRLRRRGKSDVNEH